MSASAQLPAPGLILTPDRRLRVFVSSTLEELAPERAAVRRAIEAMRLVPVMFEMGARPHPPRHLYRAYLAQSDVFLGIYWERYGWVAPGEDVSGLEDEYRLSEGKPRLLYVKDPASREPRLDTLLGELRDRDDASYQRFGNADDLARMVGDDLALMLSERFQTIDLTAAEERPAASAPLPADPTPFVGREREVAELAELLRGRQERLVTLTGPGGIGKTRLALKVAAEVAGGFPDGVRVAFPSADLDPARLPSVIAAAVGARDIGPEPVAEVLRAQLQDVIVLLVVDNLEHVISGVGIIGELLAGVPGLTVLATSRQALRLQAEHEYQVAPLTLPRPTDDLDGQRAADAVQLFAGRVQASGQDFVVDATNIDAVTQICIELDGLPLALELAAARTRVLPLTAVLARLQHGLEFLVAGPRDLPDRQQTLRRTIDWSYELLDPVEQQVFARLAIFSGAFTLDAAEAVCGDDVDVLTVVTSLTDKSLVRVEPWRTEPRLRLLSLMREYAGERLTESGEREVVAARHADYYRDLGLVAAQGLRGPGQQQWFARVGQLSRGSGDGDNLLTAVRWYLENQRPDDVAVMAWALWLPAWMAGNLDQPREIARLALDLHAPVSPAGRARLLTVFGMFSVWKGEEAVAWPALVEALSIARAEGDDDVLSYALLIMSLIQGAVDIVAAVDGIRSALELFTRRGEIWGQAASRAILGWLHVVSGQHPEQPDEFVEGITVATASGDDLMIALAEDNLAEHWLNRGDTALAAPLLTSALGRFRALRSLYTAAYAMDGVARRARMLGHDILAATLLGATDHLREEIAAPIWASASARHAALIDAVRAAAGPGFDAAWAAGRQLRFDEAVDVALGELGAVPAAAQPAGT